MTTFTWIILVLVILFVTSYLAKKLLKLESFLGLFILVKTKKLIGVVNWLSKKKIIDRLAVIGIVLGFGAFGLDYLNRNKKTSTLKRICFFMFYTIVLCFITYLLFGNVFLNNPAISLWGGYLIILLTGVMGLAGLTIGSLIFSGIDIIIKTIAGQTAAPGVGLVLPGIKMPKVSFTIPWYGWIILIFSAAVHEFFHGAMLKKFKLKIKSIGVILAGILPMGAFVEPDEKQIKKTNKHKIMKMYSAGPTSNAFLAVIFLFIILLLNVFVSPYMTNIESKATGLEITSIYETIDVDGTEVVSPVYGVLKEGDVIVSVNDTPVRSISNFSKIINDEENKFVILNTSTKEEKTEYFTPTKNNLFGFTANVYNNTDLPKNYFFLKTLLSILMWIALLNLLISSVNFLPTVPFDGGFMSQVIFSRYLKKGTQEKKMKVVKKLFGWLIIFLFIINVIPYFL